MSRFDYILDKVSKAPVSKEPFRHIYIPNLFSAEDFSEITNSPEVGIPPASSDEDLFSKLYASGYRIIEFPGCITDQGAYTAWHQTKGLSSEKVHTACEGFGMTLRLIAPKSDVLDELNRFLTGEEFNSVLADRCGVKLSDCSIDGGIQKYLDGYEISPHPDVRAKAGTFMVNINPHNGAESLNHHTHYMRFVEERKYVRDFWERAGFADRCWVPWAWCETAKTQPENNSMVLFSPSNDTLHAVKAEYDHLRGQRTQLYGNLWYKNKPKMVQVEWEELAKGDLDAIKPPRATIKDVARAVLPSSVRDALSSVAGSGRNKPNADSFHSRKY